VAFCCIHLEANKESIRGSVKRVKMTGFLIVLGFNFYWWIKHKESYLDAIFFKDKIVIGALLWAYILVGILLLTIDFYGK